MGPQFIRLIDNQPVQITGISSPAMPGAEIIGTFGSEQADGPGNWWNSSFTGPTGSGGYNPAITVVPGSTIPNSIIPQVLLIGRLNRAHLGTSVYGGNIYPVLDQPMSGTMNILPPNISVPTEDTLAHPGNGMGDLRSLSYLASDVAFAVPQLVSAIPPAAGTPILASVIDQMCRYRWTLDSHTNISGGQSTLFGVRFFGATPDETGIVASGPYAGQSFEGYGSTYGSERGKRFSSYLNALGNAAEPEALRVKGWKCVFQNFILNAGLSGDIPTGIPTNEGGGQAGGFWTAPALLRRVFYREPLLMARITAALAPSAMRTAETQLFYRSPVTGDALYGAHIPEFISPGEAANPSFNRAPFARCAVHYGDPAGAPDTTSFTYCGNKPGRYEGQNLLTSIQFFAAGGIGAYRVISSGLAANSALSLLMFPSIKAGLVTSIIEDYIRDYFVKGFNAGMFPGAPNASAQNWADLRSELIFAINEHNAHPEWIAIPLSRADDVIATIQGWSGIFATSGHWHQGGCQTLNNYYRSLNPTMPNRTCN